MSHNHIPLPRPSDDPTNILEMRPDGFYVPGTPLKKFDLKDTSSIEVTERTTEEGIREFTMSSVISTVSENALEVKEDGLYARTSRALHTGYVQDSSHKLIFTGDRSIIILTSENTEVLFPLVPNTSVKELWLVQKDGVKREVSLSWEEGVTINSIAGPHTVTMDAANSVMFVQVANQSWTMVTNPALAVGEVTRAQAWAESPGEPDPALPGSKSSKTWALLSKMMKESVEGILIEITDISTAIEDLGDDLILKHAEVVSKAATVNTQAGIITTQVSIATDKASIATSASGTAVSAATAAEGYKNSAAQSATDAQDIKDNLLSDLEAASTTLPPGSVATATWDPITQTITIGVPRGDKGEKGDKGDKGDKGLDGDGAGDMIGANNLSEVTDDAIARSNIGAASTSVATTSDSGLMSSADKTKLNGIDAGAQVNVPTDLTVTYNADNVFIQSSTGNTITITPASLTGDGKAGVMSKLDRETLNTVSQKLNKAGGTGIGGFTAAAHGYGNLGGLTITPDPTATSNFKTGSNNGAWTLAAPTVGGCYTISMLVANTTTPGAMTATGFNKVHGSFKATASINQILTIEVFGTVKVLTIKDAS